MTGTVPRIGLVVVHGIGPQRCGDTAGQVLDGLDAVTIRLQDCDPPWSHDDPTRAYVVVRRQLIPDGPEVDLLVVDAWWDDVVGIEAGLRRRLRTWLWSLRVAPLMLQVSAAAGMASAMERSQRRVAETTPTRWQSSAVFLTGARSGEWGWILRALHSALLRFLVLPPFLLVGLIVFLPMLQIIDTIWRILTRAKNSSAGTLLDLALRLTCGDAWAFVSDSERRARILRRVRDTLEWADARCDSVVLVGHSQGGAISRALISEGARADQLVTVGSGANLLGVLLNTARKPQVSIISWLMLIGYPAFVVSLFVRFTQDIVAYAQIILGALADTLTGRYSVSSFMAEVIHEEIPNFILLLGILLLMGVARLAMGWIHFDPSTLRPPIASWWDVTSVYDPVCVGGHVMEKDVHGVDVVNSTRPRDLPREHITYFGNPAVSGVIVAALASAQGKRHVEPKVQPLVLGARWHQRLAQYWWWGLPITLGAAFLVIRSYHELISLIISG
jgi:pimeloyl-ACP methyl ester carboxylesterase